MNIRKVRKQRGIRQEDIAREIGVRRDTYSHYEKGITPIPSDKLIQIAEILNESIDYLLGMSGLPRSSTDENVKMLVSTVQKAYELSKWIE